MYVISVDTYNKKGVMTDQSNICLFQDWHAAQEYMKMIASKHNHSDRDLSIFDTGAGFIVSFNDGLKRDLYYKCEKILVKG